MITLSYLKSHWKDILRFCSFHGLGISELLPGVLTSQKQGTGDEDAGSPFVPPTRHVQKHPPALPCAPLFREQSPFRARPTTLQLAVGITVFTDKAARQNWKGVPGLCFGAGAQYLPVLTLGDF